MRVFNVNKTEELKEYDLNLGHLESDTLVTHVEAVEGVEGKGHYETVREYPNGGKDVEWVVDIPRVEAVEEHDETEDILVYIPYTKKELTKINLQIEKGELKAWLKAHDYIGVKIATGRATIDDYADEIALMTEKANRINEINELLENL